jgi:single-stranded-DNA-specific exonuclease
VLGSTDWHSGVIGIVASRLVDAYHRPTIVVALGENVGQGSGRSVPGFDLHSALSCCSKKLLSFGGHKAAAGLKLHPGDFADFAREFDEHCRPLLTPEIKQRVIWIDAEVHLGVLERSVVEQIELLEPYGMGNPRPLFLAQPVQLAGEVKSVGADGAHAQLRLRQGKTVVKAVAWNLSSRFKSLDPADSFCVVFQPCINEWNDRREVQLEVKDMRPIGSSEAAGLVAASPAIN